jgi:hypothetical protein
MSAEVGSENSSAVDVNNSYNNQSSSVNRQDNRGSKFNYNDYFEKKSMQQYRYQLKSKQLNEHSQNEAKLQNCCIITIDNNTKVTVDILLESLKAALSEEVFKSIVQVGQYISTKNWSIHFKDSSNFQKAINTKFKVEDNLFELTESKEFCKKREQSVSQKVFKMTAFLRIHWLPLDVSDDKICEFIRHNLPEVSIVELIREKARTNGEVNNGVVKIKVQYELKSSSSHQSFLDFVGLHRVSGYQALFQISGMPPKCLGCNCFGHIRKNCPKCTSCNKFGHISSDCNLAKRTANQPSANVNLDFDENDIVIDPEAMVSGDQLTEPRASTEDSAGIVLESENSEKLVSQSTKSSDSLAAPEEVSVVDSVPANSTMKINELEVLKVVAPSVSNPQSFSLLSSSSKIFKTPISLAVKKEALSDDVNNKKKIARQAKYKARKEKIQNEALIKYADEKNKKENRSKEEIITEFEAMNAQAKSEVLKPFHMVKTSTQTKNAGSKLVSASKMSAHNDTDYENSESDSEKKFQLFFLF